MKLSLHFSPKLNLNPLLPLPPLPLTCFTQPPIPRLFPLLCFAFVAQRWATSQLTNRCPTIPHLLPLHRRLCHHDFPFFAFFHLSNPSRMMGLLPLLLALSLFVAPVSPPPAIATLPPILLPVSTTTGHHHHLATPLHLPELKVIEWEGENLNPIVFNFDLFWLMNSIFN